MYLLSVWTNSSPRTTAQPKIFQETRPPEVPHGAPDNSTTEKSDDTIVWLSLLPTNYSLNHPIWTSSSSDIEVGSSALTEKTATTVSNRVAWALGHAGAYQTTKKPITLRGLRAVLSVDT
jgi:hypothetical protein